MLHLEPGGIHCAISGPICSGISTHTLQETTINFWFKKDFPFTTPGLFSREPSPSYIKLLEDTMFVGILHNDFMTMRKEYDEVEILTEIIRGHYDKLRHIMEEDFRFPAERRIKRLEDAHPNIYNLTEIKHIAEYHHISVKTLSRLRNR